MKLLVDCHCFDYGEAQGINTYIRELYKALIPLSKDITYVFAAQNIERIRRIFGSNENVEYVKLGNHNKYYRLALEYPQLIKANQIDWAHFQYTSPLIKNCKTIVTLHDILFEDFPTEFPLSYRISKHILFKSSARRADLLLTVSDYSKERISKKYNIPQNNIFVTHNGVSNAFSLLNNPLANNQIKQNYNISNYILYVSRFEPRKNQQALLKAYKNLNLKELGYDLVFIGLMSIVDEGFDNELSSCDKDTLRHIHCFQNIPYEELKNWYAGASLFVYPSKAEGFGIPPLEAGACCIPVVCNNQTAMADFSFFTPYHFNTDNQKLLEQAISDILKLPPSVESLNKIKNKIYERYSWNNIAKDFYNYLRYNISV